MLSKLINTTKHRPWELPKKSWSYYQEWNDTVFLHWKVDYEELKKHIPSNLEIELFDSSAWVSVVVFNMENIRPKYLPAISVVSDFKEINIRTYVKHNNKSGVYFLSIEASKKLSCKIANIISGLPYRFSKIHKGENLFKAFNKTYKDKLCVNYKVGEPLNNKSELDIWLTEKYALFNKGKSDIKTFEIHHLEWQINSLELINIEFNYLRFSKLIHSRPDKVHYSKGVKVLAWD